MHNAPRPPAPPHPAPQHFPPGQQPPIHPHQHPGGFAPASTHPRSGTGSGRGPWLAVAIVSCVVVLAVVTSLALVFFGRDGVTARFHEPDRSAEHLTSAAVNLLGEPGTRFQGWFSGGDDQRITVDATVTNEGATLATLRIDGDEIELAATGDRVFVRADKDFWSHQGAPSESIDQYGTRWVKVAPDFLGVDLRGVLNPGALARDLGTQAELGRTSAERTVTLDGVKVLEIRAQGITAYVTDTTPRRLVRIAASPDTGPSPAPSSIHTSRRNGPAVFVPAQAPAGTGFQVDLSGLSDKEVDSLYRKLKKKLRELKSAIDSQVRFALDGTVSLSPCTTSGCRANVSITNTVSSGSPYLQAKQPVHAEITIRMTLDGRPVATCRKTKTMKPNGSASTSCFANYYIPPSRNPRTHTVEALVSAVARAVVTADIKKMVSDLAKEQARNQPVPDREETPSPKSPSPSPSKDPCDVDPFLDPQGERHTTRRHFPDGDQHTDQDSTWDPDVDLYELAEDSADFPARMQANGRCVRVGNAGRPIGTDEHGRLTSTYTVVHLTNGRVWTMHPGRPRGS